MVTKEVTPREVRLDELDPEEDSLDDYTWVDEAGNEYPTDFFTLDALDHRGKLSDDYGDYFPFMGNREPVDGYCNRVLPRSPDRFGEPRFCKRELRQGQEFCRQHRGTDGLYQSIRELFQHGLHAKTVEHVYDRVSPFKRLAIHGLTSFLMADSEHTYAPDYELREFDFSVHRDIDPEDDTDPDVPFKELPDEIRNRLDVNDTLYVEIPYATERVNRAGALYEAAVNNVKMHMSNAEITAAGMAVSKTEHAQLTSPTEEDPTQQFKTIDTTTEHPLNLAYSRLIRDNPKLLAYGGVETGTDADGGEGGAVEKDFKTAPVAPNDLNESSGYVEQTVETGPDGDFEDETPIDHTDGEPTTNDTDETDDIDDQTFASLDT
jgi:hypothetical protein